jgi:hypothetical protein
MFSKLGVTMASYVNMAFRKFLSHNLRTSLQSETGVVGSSSSMEYSNNKNISSPFMRLNFSGGIGLVGK